MSSYKERNSKKYFGGYSYLLLMIGALVIMLNVFFEILTFKNKNMDKFIKISFITKDKNFSVIEKISTSLEDAYEVISSYLEDFIVENTGNGTEKTEITIELEGYNIKLEQKFNFYSSKNLLSLLKEVQNEIKNIIL